MSDTPGMSGMLTPSILTVKAGAPVNFLPFPLSLYFHPLPHIEGRKTSHLLCFLLLKLF